MADPRGIRAGRAYVELGVDNQLTRGLNQVSRQLERFGSQVAAIGARIFALGSAGVSGFAAAAAVFASTGDALAKMSKRTGIGVEALAELTLAAELGGASMEELEAGIARMQRAIAAGTAGDFVGGLRGLPPEEQLARIADMLAAITDPTLRAARAIEIFGRRGTALLPMLQGGRRELERVRLIVLEFGLSLSPEAAARAEQLNDAWQIMRRSMRFAAAEIGSIVAPIFERAVLAAARIAAKLKELAAANPRLVSRLLKVSLIVAAVGGSLIAAGFSAIILGAAFSGLASIASAVAGVFGLIWSALVAATSATGFMIVGIASLGVALVGFTQTGRSALEAMGGWFVDLGNIAHTTIGGVLDALAGGDFKLAGEVAMAGLELAWLTATERMRAQWSIWSSAIAVTWTETVGAIKIGMFSLAAFISRIIADMVSGLSRLIDQVAKALPQFTPLAEAFRKFVLQPVLIGEGVVSAAEEAEIDALEKRINDLRDSLTNLSGDELDKARRELEDARKKLDDARERARAKREKTQSLIGGFTRRFFDDIESAVAAVDIAARGTFNPFAVRALTISPNSAAERTAKASEQTAENTRRLVDMMGLPPRFG